MLLLDLDLPLSSLALISRDGSHLPDLRDHRYERPTYLPVMLVLRL